MAVNENLKFDPSNPFNEEAPKIVHFEKDESHYEYCRMQMHDIERVHRRTFIANMAICIFVCFLAVFRQSVQCFALFSTPFAVLNESSAALAGGIFQILVAMAIIVVGYLAWANFHTLNILLAAWYAFVVILAVMKVDYLSAIIGVVGFAFYFFSIQAMRREGALAQMEGYPNFHEKFDIEKSDIVVQTLLAHKGEKRERPSFFNTTTSLRKKKKKAPTLFDTPDFNEEPTNALADSLSKQLAEKKNSAMLNETQSGSDEAHEDTP